ncbi:MAG: DUF1893 domain-containing protein [Oscillospiraceae bacterium]|nr:DUF1893 domain-containing protein [Oscillospiraceae bacterium]
MNIKTAIAALDAHGCSVAAALADGRILTENGHSVRPLFKLYGEHGAALCGAAVADKIIGKAAASVLVAAGAQEAFAYLMSESGLLYLLRNGISASYAALVPFIENRTGTDLCPMEKLVDGCGDATECVRRIGDFIKHTPYPG